MRTKCLKLGTIIFAAAVLSCGRPEATRQPIIDVHLHSESLENLKDWGPNPVTGKKAPDSVEEHIRQTLAEMDRYNIVLGIASGDIETVERLRQAAPLYSDPISSVNISLSLG